MSEQEKRNTNTIERAKISRVLLVMNIGTVGAFRERRILLQGPLFNTVFIWHVSFLYHILIALPYKRDKQKKLKATCFLSA